MGKSPERSDAEIEERWQTFWREHEAHDLTWPRHVLHMVAELLSFVFPFEAAGQAVTRLYKASRVELPADFDWISADEDLPASEIRKLPINRLSLALRAYAYYGLEFPQEEDSPHDLQAFLEDQENRGETYGGLFPREWFQGDDMERAYLAALARRKLDTVEGEGLTPEEVAALARIGHKSVMNLVAPSNNSGLRLNEHRLIPLEDARRWLLSRRDFYPTISSDYTKLLSETEQDTPEIDDPIFVPATEDGQWFSPKDSRIPMRAKRSRKIRSRITGMYYRVGDANFDDYWQALSALTRMEPPRWRRPDPKKRTRDTIGTKWIRKSRRDLEAELQAVSYEEQKREGE